MTEPHRQPWRCLWPGAASLLIILLVGGSSTPSAAALSPAATNSPHPWRQIVEAHMAPFAGSGISREMVEAAASLRFTSRVLVHNNSLYVDDRRAGGGWDPILRLQPWLWMLSRLLCRERVRDVELVLSWVDQPRARRSAGPLPVLGWSTTDNHWDIAIPYPRTFLKVPYAPNASEVKWVNASTWKKKADIAYWRGSTTGGPWLPGSWRAKPRAAVVRECHQHPADCSAEFTEFMRTENVPERVQAAMTEELGPLVRRVPFEEFLKFRYLIMVDGNAAPSARSLKSMTGDSLLLWLGSDETYREFYYPALQPFVHYVPVRDAADLVRQINWARNNTAVALDMVKASQTFALQHFNGAAINAYLLDLLTEYHRLQTFQPTRTEGYMPFVFESEEDRGKLLALAGGACPAGRLLVDAH